MFGLPTLLAIYPDALFLQLFCAPPEAITSVSSLITILRRVFSDTVDPVKIGAEAISYWWKTLAKFIGERDRLAPERIFDLSYVDLRRDPIGAVRRIYEHFGWVLSPRAENRMRQSWQNNRLICRVFIVMKQRNLDCAPNTNKNFSQDYCGAIFSGLTSVDAARSANVSAAPIAICSGRPRLRAVPSLQQKEARTRRYPNRMLNELRHVPICGPVAWTSCPRRSTSAPERKDLQRAANSGVDGMM